MARWRSPELQRKNRHQQSIAGNQQKPPRAFDSPALPFALAAGGRMRIP
jgi:hypothetical protein